MSFYSKIVDHLNATVSSKDAAKVALAARDAVLAAVKFLFEKKGIEWDEKATLLALIHSRTVEEFVAVPEQIAALDLWVVYGAEYANRDIAQWPYHRKVATFDPTATNKTVPFAADGFPRNIDIRYVRFVLLPAGTAEERLTDLGAWCQSYYVPDLRYQPGGTFLFVR